METVFILGAGASADAGAPLMATFLGEADLIHRSGQAGDAASSFDLVARGRAQLQLVHSKAQFDIHNLESVFAAFEMSNQFERLGALAPDAVPLLIPAMQQVIVRTLEATMRYPVNRDRVTSHISHRRFAELIRELRDRGHSVCIVTFNYDIGVDVALHLEGVTFGYWTDRGAHDGHVDLLKLHGSLNWAVCGRCSEIIPWKVRDILADAEARFRVQGHGEKEPLRVGNHFRTFDHCDGNHCPSEPVIVPPTANKAGYHERLRPVWVRAAERLRRAENIIVMGYSWPESDQFFRHLYALGTVGDVILRRFWVLDRNPAVVDHYRERLLGEQARTCLAPQPREALPFRDGIRWVRDRFGLSP